jgi:Tfp pilus assembly protein PilO
MKTLLPILLILGAGALFFWVANPMYTEVQSLLDEKSQLSSILDNTKKLRSLRDAMLKTYQGISADDLERLEKLLPNSVDNIRLVIDIDSIASQYGLSIKRIVFSDPSSAQNSSGDKTSISSKDKDLGSLILSFTVTSNYDNFVSFISNLEDSLRLMDIKTVQFKVVNTDLNDYLVKIETYWLDSYNREGTSQNSQKLST